MGKQRRNGVYKDGTAYSRGDKPVEDVHEVDLSRLTIENCEGCREAHMTASEIMNKRNYLGGSVHSYWFPTPTCCLGCINRTPYRVFTAKELAGNTVPHDCVTREKVHQVLAGVEMCSAQRNLDLMHRIRMCEDNIEMGRQMLRRTKQEYAGVKPAKRPPELIARIKRELEALDNDRACPSKARLLFRCVDRDLSYTLHLMIQTKQGATRAPGDRSRWSRITARTSMASQPRKSSGMKCLWW